MHAMVFNGPGRSLVLREVPRPEPGPGQVLVKVSACGVCRTDLHVCDGDLTEPKPAVIPGHEIVGYVVALGEGDLPFSQGQRVGIPWLGFTCGQCDACRAGRENLCDAARFTGYTLDGGYAEYAVADARYCFPLPDGLSDAETAPLLCAGLIGYRSLRMAGDAQRLGLYGFGAAAHIVAQVARWQGRQVYGFVRPGDAAARAFALRLGASWAGDSDQPGPEPLDLAIELWIVRSVHDPHGSRSELLEHHVASHHRTTLELRGRLWRDHIPWHGRDLVLHRLTRGH